MRVVAKKRLPYAGVYYKPGQEFDIEDKHFKVLSFIGKVEKAKPAPEPEPAPKAKAAPVRRRATTQNRTVKAEDSDESGKDESETSEQKRGTYSRRDMKAED